MIVRAIWEFDVDDSEMDEKWVDIKGYEGLYQISDRLNNNVDNLEWATHKDNSKYMVEKNRDKKGIEVRRQKLGKKITGISPEGEIVFFDSTLIILFIYSIKCLYIS